MLYAIYYFGLVLRQAGVVRLRFWLCGYGRRWLGGGGLHRGDRLPTCAARHSGSSRYRRLYIHSLERQLGLCKNLDGDSRLLVPDGLELALGHVEGSLCATARRSAVVEGVWPRPRAREGAGVHVTVIEVKALSSPVGAGDGGHWQAGARQSCFFRSAAEGAVAVGTRVASMFLLDAPMPICFVRRDALSTVFLPLAPGAGFFFFFFLGRKGAL